MLNKLYTILSLIAIGVLVYFLMQKPEVEYITVAVPVQVRVPSESNTFETVEPTEKIVYKKNPVNKDLLLKYQQAIDSIEKLKLYKDAIAHRSYEEVFEDSIQTITVNARTTGTLDTLSVNYVTKERTISTTTKAKVPIPKKNKIFLGGDMTLPTNNLTPVITGRVLLKNKEDNMLSVGFNTEGTLSVGYFFNPF